MIECLRLARIKFYIENEESGRHAMQLQIIEKNSFGKTESVIELLREMKRQTGEYIDRDYLINKYHIKHGVFKDEYSFNIREEINKIYEKDQQNRRL